MLPPQVVGDEYNSRMQRFDPIAQLFSLEKATPPTDRFAARTADDAARWQRRTRAKLRDVLGFQSVNHGRLRAKQVSLLDRGDHRLSEYHIPVAGGAVMPVFVLEPPGKARNLPCVVALHGHGSGVNSIIGRDKDGNDRLAAAENDHRDFAVELVRRGFLVAAPEINCFGRRVGSFDHLREGVRPTTCYMAGAVAQMLGGSILGLRVAETMRAIDFLKTHPRIGKRIGIMGLSGGGMLALFTAALDLRITAAVISGYFCSWKYNIQAMRHCLCNYVPGISRIGDVSDIAALIAPRPMLVEHGVHDPIMPIAGTRMNGVTATGSSTSGAWPRRHGDVIEGRYGSAGAASARGFVSTAPLGRPIAVSAVITAAFAA